MNDPRRGVLNLFPRFIALRKRGYPRELASELRVSEHGLFIWMYLAVQIAENGFVSVDRHHWRTPYFTFDMWSPLWREHVAAGLAEEAPGGWRITDAGFGAIARVCAAARTYLASLPVPTEQATRASRALSRIAGEIPRDAERAQGAKRLAPDKQRATSWLVAIDQAVLELWAYRDDCHIAAWSAAGYEGPAIDVLTQIWAGATDEDVVFAKLQQPAKVEAPKQTRGDVQQIIKRLLDRGDVAVAGRRVALTGQGRSIRDRIEVETDGPYFRIWKRVDDAASLLDDLSRILTSVKA